MVGSNYTSSMLSCLKNGHGKTFVTTRGHDYKPRASEKLIKVLPTEKSA